MNKDRRFITKVLAVGGVGILTFGGYTLLSDVKPANMIDWFNTLHLNPALKPLTRLFEQPMDLLLQHLNISQAIEFDVLEKTVHAAVKNDFELGDTVQIEQWYISKTEALILASAINVLGVVATEKVIKTYDNAPFEKFIDVDKWGPQGTYQGVKFNEQPDGHCGLWVVADNVPDALQIYIADKKRNVFINEKGFTTGVYKDVDAFINRVGKSQIIAYDEINHRKQIIGDFEVSPFNFYKYEDQTMSKVFSEIRKWGPQQAKLGEVFNILPNGNAAFWIKGTSISREAKLRFNNKEHAITISKDTITTSFSPKHLPKTTGKFPVYLVDDVYSEELLLGFMEIN